MCEYFHMSHLLYLKPFDVVVNVNSAAIEQSLDLHSLHRHLCAREGEESKVAEGGADAVNNAFNSTATEQSLDRHARYVLSVPVTFTDA